MWSNSQLKYIRQDIDHLTVNFLKNRQYDWLIFIFLGWLGYASGSLFFKASTSTVDFNLIKIDDLNVEKVVVSSNETTLSRPGKFTQYSLQGRI